MRHFLTAQEAATELGITLPTLYSYVSRGLIRSDVSDSDPRARRYHAEDVRQLKARKESRRNPERVAETALHLGTPVLESAITLIENGHLYYRGHDAVELAARHSLEEVAALIWTGDLHGPLPALTESIELPARWQAASGAVPELTAFQQFQVMLPLAAADDLAAYDLRPAAVVRTGARILRLLAAIAAGTTGIHTGIAAALQRAWIPHNEEAARLLDAALILCADHELNVSSFTARCVASANSTPYAAVIAGLAALQGTRHGGHTERVEALLREAGRPEAVYETMAGRLRRGETIPGFGHPLYPEGDPRGAALLRWIAEADPASPALVMADAAVAAAQELIGEPPTIDLALVTLSRALALPAGSPLTLFALGRTVGWMGQALEQYALDRMIRPRARYVGEWPAPPT
ncbi:MAG: citrate synthase family protein [Chloroflexi bacterium]|nr:citrate synthase family protein [Chloroflexota bacterium]